MNLSAAVPSDAEEMARECDFPAMQQNPLYRLNFPNSNPNDAEAEIQWMIKGLKESLSNQDMSFWKVCTEDGELMGFAGWTLSPSKADQSGKNSAENNCTKAIPPKSMDITTSREVTRRFAAEKKRVLQGREHIWRMKLMKWRINDCWLSLLGLNLISVKPVFQRMGVGSLLVSWCCQQADQDGRDIFLIASSAALRLYKKFDFKEVGEIEYGGAKFTSMLRKRSCRPLPWPCSIALPCCHTMQMPAACLPS